MFADRADASSSSTATAFLTAETEPDRSIVGRLVEFGSTKELFTHPRDERAESYLTGRFG